MKLYICCALSTASDELKQKVEALKAHIKIHYPLWQVLEFFGLGPAANDGEIFRYDVDRVFEADLIVVLCDEPTWGGGIEIGMALERGKCLVFIAPRAWKKTRMITGLCETHPNQRCLCSVYLLMVSAKLFPRFRLLKRGLNYIGAKAHPAKRILE